MSACPSSQSKVLNRRLGNLLIGNRVADSVQEGSKRRNHVGMFGANCGVRLALQFPLKLARRRDTIDNSAGAFSSCEVPAGEDSRLVLFHSKVDASPELFHQELRKQRGTPAEL